MHKLYCDYVLFGYYGTSYLFYNGTTHTGLVIARVIILAAIKCFRVDALKYY